MCSFTERGLALSDVSKEHVSIGHRRRSGPLVLVVIIFVISLTATVVFGLITANLNNQRGNAAGPPRVTVTITVTATPRPVVTITHVVTATDGGGSSAWVAIAALGTLVAGLGTLGGGVAAVLALRGRTASSTNKS